MSGEYRIVCGHCRSINKIPGERRHDRPKCGKCHQPLLDGTVPELDDRGFARLLSGNDQPLLVMFHAPWCGYCRQTRPAFNQTAARLAPDFQLVTVDTENNRATAGRYAIKGLPTFVLFRNNREVARLSGAMTTEQLIGWVRSQVR